MAVDEKIHRNSKVLALSESPEPSETPPEPAPIGTPAGGESWFASNETVTLQLGGGRWIEIKEELTYLETGKLKSAGVTYANNAMDVREVDLGVWGLFKIKLWIVDWNAKDHNGKAMPCTAAAIDDLRSDQAEEILDAIRAHEAALAARKNPLSTETK